MTDVREILTDEVKGLQESAKSSLDDRLRWFATLELESATVEGDMITFVWRDSADNARHGWRWEILPRERWDLFTAHLDEDFATTDPTEPDEKGIRWWGVFENGTIVAPWWKARRSA